MTTIRMAVIMMMTPDLACLRNTVKMTMSSIIMMMTGMVIMMIIPLMIFLVVA